MTAGYSFAQTQMQIVGFFVHCACDSANAQYWHGFADDEAKKCRS